MDCPKCGQEMIHINNQYICTACGIVASEFSPKSQVLASIKKKMTATQTGPKGEEYISPVAAVTQANPQNILSLHPNPETDARGLGGKTFDEITREMVNQNQSRASEGSPSMPGFSADLAEGVKDAKSEGEKVIPRAEEQQKTESIESQPNNSYPLAEANAAQQASGTLQQDIEAKSLFTSSMEGVQGTETVPEAAFYPETGATESKTVYPSHQVNPILLRIFIAVFSLLVFCVIVYLLYANLNLARGLIDNIIRFLGESIFR